jgi:hypothetical protein
MNMKYNYLFLGVLLVLGLASCRNFNDLGGLDKEGIDTEFAIPVMQTKASLQNLLEKFDDYTVLETDENGLILLRYQGDVVTKDSEEIFDSIQSALPPIPIPVVDSVFNLPFSTPGGMDIDFVRFKKGTLYYGFQSYHEDDIVVKVKFPQAFKPNGEPLEFTHIFNYIGSTPITLIPPVVIDLTNHTLEADADGNIQIVYECIKQSTGERVLLDNFLLQLQDLEFSYAEGYFGEYVHEGDRDTILIEFFENWVRGDVKFEDPKIFIRVFNSFGVPTRSNVKLFDIYTVDDEVLPLVGDAIATGIDFDYPTLDEIGEEKITEFTFEKNNSNIVDVLKSGPVALDYDVDAVVNPDNDEAIRGFITDNSRYTATVEVELPIYGTAAGFAAIDTFDLDFERFEEVEEVEFKLISKNQLPLEVGLQLYFADEAGTIIDSLLSSPEPFLEAAPVDEEGEVIESTETINYIPFSADRFAKIREAKQLILNAAFSTFNNGNTSVKVYEDQEVEILLGMKIKTQ